MKNSLVLSVLVSVALCGCATKEMKSTPFYEGADVASADATAGRLNLWPLVYWREPTGSVLWPLISFSDDHFALRPIYSQYKQGGKGGAWDEFNFLWPLAQFDSLAEDYYFFPIFWGRDLKGQGYQALFPLYWNGADSNALFPLWYYGSTTNSWSFNTIAGLAGACRTETGSRNSWLFPLWFESNDGSWLTPLGGRLNDDGSTAIFITPLAGVESGKRTGGWLFPIWSHEKDEAFEDRLALMDSPKLPSCITDPDECIEVHDETAALLHDADHLVWGSRQVTTNAYALYERFKRGNRLTVNYSRERAVLFDLKTGKKVADREKGDIRFFLWLYHQEWDQDRMSGDDHARYRALLGLWDWRVNNGDDSLDMFPGFTYDSRTDGYRKTSFFWRLFRYERNLETGTSIDFCFIPIWR